MTSASIEIRCARADEDELLTGLAMRHQGVRVLDPGGKGWRRCR